MRLITIRHCQVTSVRTPVTELTHATTWDGTLSNHYRVMTQGSIGCDSQGVHIVWPQLKLQASSRIYSWSRVWNLFAHLKGTQGNRSVTIQRAPATRDFLSGLMAAQDPSLEDPYVQAMVDALLTSGVPVSVPVNDVVPSPEGGNAVQRVLRWKPYIDAYAAKYRVPAVLVAAVMAQESGGRQHDRSGQVLRSGVGSGGIGALGLMQMEPSTASGMEINGRVIGANAIADLSSGPLNLELGTQYLSELYHQFGQSQEGAESAYNAGPGAQEQALAAGDLIAQNAQTLAYVTNIEGIWLPRFAPYFHLDLTVK